MLKITSSPLWKQIQDKYRNEKIEEEILGQIGVILSAEFKMIDFYDDSLDGKIIDCGSHKELLERCEYYKELYDSDLEKWLEV